MVISRAFNMSEPKVMCMLPFVDSMNHNSVNPNVVWRPRLPKGHFVVSISKDIVEGEELTACYHSKTEEGKVSAEMEDLRQFVMYGFSESNRYQNVQEALR
mmetsp:Transcript_899/g.1257  ORF Transcript_899/g.1257 Transcript_899/m.1257 type:complete len:101 (+) Transcript_899:465-767(+)